MKRIVLFTLLFAAAAVSAHAAVGPKPNLAYKCYYWNYSGLAVNGGKSVFAIPGSGSLRSGIEYYDAFHPRFGYYTENQKVTFSNPVAIRERDPETGLLVIVGWRWQFTVNPAGPQCTADVYDDGDSLEFYNCSNGHSRSCSLLP
jgi:hypothetical protein